MLAKFNKLDVAESVTESLSLESQKDIKVTRWGWIAFSRKEKYVSVVQRKGSSGNATTAFCCRD